MTKPRAPAQPTKAHKADERDRVAAELIRQEHARMLVKTERLRGLRLARDAQVSAAEAAAPPPSARARKPAASRAKAATKAT